MVTIDERDERDDRTLARHWAREQEAGVVAVRIFSNWCGVCDGWLDTNLEWPHPMATTVGHEPPLSRTMPGDRVLRRPEHWACNLRKGTRTDGELPARTRTPPYPVLARCGPDVEGDRRRRALLEIRENHDVRADIRGPETPGDSR